MHSDLYERAVEKYLNPRAQPGCGRHTDPDCLCDVDLTRHPPVAITDIPPTFHAVESFEDLLEAAAVTWVYVDILKADRNDHSLALEDVPDDKIVKAADMIANGASLAQTKAACGFNVNGRFMATVRRAHGYENKNDHWNDSVTELVLRMGNEGKSAHQTAFALQFELNRRIDQKVIRERYQQMTGKRMARAKISGNTWQTFPAERVLELHAEGKTTSEIKDILTIELQRTMYTQAVRRFLDRKGLTPNAA